MTVIYLDMLLALNLVIDFLLLSGCARVLQLSTSRVRLIAGAAVGALSSLLILLPPMNIPLTLLCKLGTALLMVPIAFSVRSVKRFVKASVALFVISALFAGVCSGICLLTAPAGAMVQSGIVYVQIPPLLLLALTTASYGILCLYDRFTRRRMAQGAAFRLDIYDGDTHVTLRALFDSGHRLRESFSGAPVILVSCDAVRTLRATVPASTPSPTRYIPFSSIGGGGMLPSFRPTRAVLHTADASVELNSVWVAVCDQLQNDEYDALIGPDLANLL